MLNLNRLKKEEIIWLSKHKCRHGHSYLSHPNCILTEKPNMCPVFERVGHLDIECTGLNANFDYIISYAIKVERKIRGRVLTKREVLNPDILDKNLLKEFYQDIQDLDRITVYWGKDRRHDLPFLRTRALKWGVDFPLYRDIYLTDVYDIVKGKLRLHANRLENVANFLKIPCKQHKLDPEIWQRAKLGDKKALNHIWLHNKEDVITLEKVYDKLRGFVRESKTSI